MYKIADLHMHIVPGVDDGSRTIEESIEMLKMAKSQGVTDVFCTSHNGYCEEDGERYLNSFNALRKAVEEANIGVRLHKGCEVLCAGDYIDDIIYGLDIGVFQTLGNSKYVLTELYSDTKPSEALLIIKTLKEHGYQPVIAHMERNYNITGRMVGLLIVSGALIQINAISLSEENDIEIKGRAKELLNNRFVHFIGSDSHRIDHRSPNIASGIQYILENVEPEYAELIISKNVERILRDQIDE